MLDFPNIGAKVHNFFGCERYNIMKRLLASLPPWAVTIVISAAIVYLTLAPSPLPADDIPLFEGADKVVHAIMFGMLCGALALDTARARGVDALTRGRLWWCFVVAAAVGGVIELAQGAMHLGRSAEWWDFVADIAGALLAMLVARPVVSRMLGVRR